MPESGTTVTKWYKKFVPYIKDAVYVIGIVVSLFGWIRAKTENKVLLETTVKYNTEAIKEFEKFMNKQIEFNITQAGINGELLEYKNSHP